MFLRATRRPSAFACVSTLAGELGLEAVTAAVGFEPQFQCWTAEFLSNHLFVGKSINKQLFDWSLKQKHIYAGELGLDGNFDCGSD